MAWPGGEPLLVPREGKVIEGREMKYTMPVTGLRSRACAQSERTCKQACEQVIGRLIDEHGPWRLGHGHFFPWATFFSCCLDIL